MSGIDERPQPTLTFVQLWPIVEKKLERARTEQDWDEANYIYYRMLAMDELNEWLRKEGSDVRDR